MVVDNALIDTGASFSTIECRLLALLNYQDIDEFKSIIRETCKDTVVPRLAMELGKNVAGVRVYPFYNNVMNEGVEIYGG